ncbi:hypothetical protein PFISCL1PPCAC_19468, partial [Pristionchus fissidentatus]
FFLWLSVYKMEDLTRGVGKLSVRSGSKTNIERRRLGSEKEIDPEKKTGFLSSIKRLFVSDAKIDEAGKEKDECRKESQPVIQKPLYHAFHPVPNLPLPQVDDCPDFNTDICDYMYHFQAAVPANFLVDRAISATQRQRIVTFIAERHGDFQQPLESFHLAVFLIDSMLIANELTSENAEVMCIAALSLASKHERQVGLSRQTLRDYDMARRLRYETRIFRKMNYCLGQHTVIHLMRILSAALYTKSYRDANEANAWNSAKVLSQLAAMDASLVGGTKPSLLAAAILRLSLALIGRKWMELYTLQSQHNEEEIRQKTRVLYKLTKKTFDINTNAIICHIVFNQSGADFIRKNLSQAAQIIDNQ